MPGPEGIVKNNEPRKAEPSLAEIMARLGALEAAVTAAVEKLPALEAVARAAETLEKLPGALAVQAAAMTPAPVQAVDDKPFLTVAEAAERGRLSKCFIYRMINQGRLHIEGRPKGYRIWKKHFDDQLALGWPVLDAADPVEAMRRSRAAGSVAARIPRPKRPAIFNSPCPKLV